jgi:hypothetical protein
MNPLDKELYRLFSTGVPDYSVHSISYPEPPQLHDVFRVAEEKYDLISVWYLWLVAYSLVGNVTINIPYNSTLPLLQQSDSTKQSLIELFA